MIQRTANVFLSYARNDDEPFVSRLVSDLKAHGFDVWWDRVSMSARGRTFLYEIRDAIDLAGRFLLVVGPNALTSDYVITELQYAITYGKVINPILRLGGYELVPDELKSLHVEDFRDDKRYALHLENLVRQLSEPVEEMGKLVGLPSLPLHQLARRDCLKPLKDTLLADLHGPVVMTGVAARLGMHGMGGIGKSVLANLLARDTEVRRAFPDGIIWVPLGTEPNLVKLQRNIAKVFADPGYFENVDQGCAKLTELLDSRSVLLILDDVWERGHGEAFNVLGRQCRALITTRDAGLAKSLGGTQHHIELLTEAEGLKLLGDIAGVHPNDLPPEAKEIVSECGRLPLAVALCGGMVNDIGWSDVVERLRKSALESIFTDHPEYEHHRNLWKAMKVSVDALTPHEQQRFVELSVFPEEISVPEEAIHTLWSYCGKLGEFAGQDLLTKLYRRSLIRISIDPPQAGRVRERSVSIHDLLYDFVRRLAGDTTALHSRLLDAYASQCAGVWPQCPDDGWFLRHVKDHFIAAGKVQDLVRLLLDLQWLERKNEAGLIFDLVEDFASALALLPHRSVDRRRLSLIAQALRRDLNFIARHSRDYPQALFQCLWNSCWWYDCKGLEAHYEYFQPGDGSGYGRTGDKIVKAPARKSGRKLCSLMEAWRKGKEARTPAFVWLRSLRPPPLHLSTALEAVFDLGDNVNLESSFSDDGSRLAARTTRDISVWEVQSGKKLFHQQFSTDTESLCLSPDGTLLAFSSQKQRVTIVELRSGRERLNFFDHRQPLTTVSFSPAGTRICSGSKDGSVRIWCASSGKLLARFNSHKASVLKAAFTIDGLQVISVADDWTARTLDASTGPNCDAKNRGK